MARPTEQALVSDQAAERLDPSGFDPSREAWPLCGYAPGDYLCECVKCRGRFQGDKRALECLECAAASAKFLMDHYARETRRWREWFETRRKGLDELIHAASVFWGVGSEQHNLVRDVADGVLRDWPRDSDESGEAGETQGGSTEGDSATSEGGIARG